MFELQKLGDVRLFVFFHQVEKLLRFFLVHLAEHVDGVYTGKLVGEMLHGPAKAVAVAALAEKEGLDLTRCSAYSDSSNDLPLLGLVGDPCAVNPDAKLRAHAREQGWRIRDYRTARKAARTGLIGAAVAGAVVGGAGVAARGRKSG